MKKQNISSMVAAIALCAIGFMSVNAFAGQDEMQRQMTQQVMKAKQKLKEAEAASGADRQKLMHEHMQMMQGAMKKMQEMRPKAGMSMQEHEDWMNEHQKLMEEMMGQMMGEHHMMMGMDCMGKAAAAPKSKADEHQH